MTARTGIIKYNLTERGRSVRGPARNFDIPALARMINGPDVQERVKHGDMIGYFGHWPRVQFGLNPAEGGVVNGKAVAIEPAIRTISIKADPVTGDVEHEAEFLDTASGKIAARMWASKAGGFSSAINTRPVGDKAFPLGFHGFDYVNEPNYSTNRGYGLALDGVFGEEDMFDAVAERQAMLDQCASMLDTMQAEYDRMAATLDKVTQENTYYVAQLAKREKPAAMLDGIMDLTTNVIESPLRHADDFLNAHLPVIAQPKQPEPERTASHNRQLGRYEV